MTITRTNTAEGGTAGTAVTAANSGGASGDAFDIVSAGAGHTLTYSASSPFAGSLCYDIGTDTSTVQVVLRWGDTLAQAQAAIRFYVKISALPNVAVTIAHLSTTSTTRAAHLSINTGGKLLVQDSTGAALFTSTNALPTNTWLRVELWAIPGTTTSNGQIGGGYAVGNAALSESFSSTATVNAATGTINRIQCGKLAGSFAAAQHYFIDTIAVADVAAFIGPPATNVAPTANAGPDQTNVEPWSTVTLTGTDSDSDGTIASRSWTQTAGSPTATLSGSGATRTFEAPATLAGTTLTFTYTVTDNGGATGTDTVSVTVLPVTERAVIGGVEVPMQIRVT